MQKTFETGMAEVINASGRMTKLGASVQSEYVQKMMQYASSRYFIMDELYVKAGEKIADLLGTVDCVVTSSASSGIAFVIASLICGDSTKRVVDLPTITVNLEKRNVVIPKGHNVDYGVPIHTVVEMAGGNVVEAGSANKATVEDVEGCIDENTIALMYVKSHHCVQKNMISLENMISIAKAHKIPILVDAAAEESLTKYYEMGADYVIYSGTKALCAPVSGLVLCNSKEAANKMRMHYYGIGRTMKIGKENIFGLVAAVEEYVREGNKCRIQIEDMESFVEKLNLVEGITASLIQDEAGRNIFRARVKFDEKRFGMSAYQVNRKLQNGNPAIFARDYQVNLGILDFDSRPLMSEEDLKKIYNRICELKKILSSKD